MLCCAANLPDNRLTPEMAGDVSPPRPRVLVAEDQASVADAITILLKQNGLDVQTVESPHAAIRALQEQFEMDEAVEIQRKLVPQTMPSIPGTEISAVLHTARPIGGDYFDVLKLSDTSLAVCVADAVGKGVPAALLMANLQAVVRAVA